MPCRSDDDGIPVKYLNGTTTNTMKALMFF